MNVRDLTGRSSSGSCTGSLISLTTGGLLVYESRGELDLVLLLDTDYRTVDLKTQPERFEITVHDRIGTYTPDVYSADVYGASAYWDVKRRRIIQADPDLGGRLEAIEAQAARRSAEFHLSAREAFRPGERLANAKRVYVSAIVHDVPAERRVARILARCPSPARLGDLTRAGLTDDLVGPLLGMVGRREAAFDMSRAIDDDLEFSW